MPARLKPPGARQRDEREPLRMVRQPTRPLPRGMSRARKVTRDWWDAWFRSGRASLLDETGVATLERLARLVDEADRADGALRLRLVTEVRRQEGALLRGIASAAIALEPRETREQFRAGVKQRQRAKLAGLDHTVWPSYEPDEGDNVTAGRYEVSIGDDDELTDAQQREVARWHEKNERKRVNG